MGQGAYSGKVLSDQLRLPSAAIRFSAGGQNGLTRAIIEEFCPRFAPSGEFVYVKDACKQTCTYLNEACIQRLGISVENRSKLPDVAVYLPQKNWLFLIEALRGERPVDDKRLAEMTCLFASRAHLVVVTAARNRQTISKQIESVAWGTHVWLRDAPNHMIHFNGGCLS